MKAIKSHLFLTSFLIVLLITGCSSMKSTDVLNFVLPSGGYDKQELNYGEHSRQSLDVYIPKTKQPKTPIVFVYGGAWRDGTKEDFEFVAHALTGLGHTVIIPNYRLYPKVQFPENINDVADAIRFVEQQSASILGKPLEKVILMGHSSGAHAAALLATDVSYLKTRKVKTKIAGLIAMSGPYDLDLKNPEVILVFKNAIPKKTNPIQNIKRGMSPVLLLHGVKDTRVLPYHTEHFDNALKHAGISVTTHLYPEVEHVKILGSLAAPLRFLNNSYSDIKAFLGKLD